MMPMRSVSGAKASSPRRATTCSTAQRAALCLFPIVTDAHRRYDIARLTAFDCGVLDESKLKDEEELARLTRDNVQLLIDAVYALPMEVGSICAEHYCCFCLLLSTIRLHHKSLRPRPMATSSLFQRRPPICHARSPYPSPNPSPAGKNLLQKRSAWSIAPFCRVRDACMRRGSARRRRRRWNGTRSRRRGGRDGVSCCSGGRLPFVCAG